MTRAAGATILPAVLRHRTQVPMATPSDQLLQKIRRLPPERVAEVEDFVDFIAQRETDRHLVRAAAVVSEPAFAKVWANPEDDVYDHP